MQKPTSYLNDPCSYIAHNPISKNYSGINSGTERLKYLVKLINGFVQLCINLTIAPLNFTLFCCHLMKEIPNLIFEKIQIPKMPLLKTFKVRIHSLIHSYYSPLGKNFFSNFTKIAIGFTGTFSPANGEKLLFFIYGP
ncbi:MAG TPA: hypothetical protein P5048_00340 [Chlamydiales bacterium]|nr:hypothetical protein [Chlamydiales bacterium]